MIISQNQFDYLPGSVELSSGNPCDYRAMERFHYLPLRPATYAGVWVARFSPHAAPNPARIVGVVVLSYPSAVHAMRNRVFGLSPMRYGEKIRWANAHLRTISRVIIHPQFRSIGLAGSLIRLAIEKCPTRYVEAAARMGRAHPMFEHAGMTRVDPADVTKPIYYWIDRCPN